MWILYLYNSQTPFSLLLSSQSNVSSHHPSSPFLDRKVEETTTGLPSHNAKQLHSIIECKKKIDRVTVHKMGK
jgi:hypothetical protein